MIAQNVKFGPAKIVYDAEAETPTTLYSAADSSLSTTVKEADVNPDQYGQGTKTLLDVNPEFTFKPQSLWTILSKVYPAALIAPTILGFRLVNRVAKVLEVHGEDASLCTVPAVAQISLPSLTLGIDKGEFGEMKYGAVLPPDMELDEDGSMPTYDDAGGTYGNPTAPDYLACGEWSFAWGANVLTGDLLKEVVITPDLKLEPVMMGQILVDWRLMGIQFNFSVQCDDNLEARHALFNAATNFVRGSRNTARSHDGVLTSSLGHTFTGKSLAPTKFELVNGMKDARHGPITFETSVQSGARIAWTTPA